MHAARLLVPLLLFALLFGATLPAARSEPAEPAERPLAVILLGNHGTEITDFLGPYAVLSSSGSFDVKAVAPERVPSTLSGGVSVLPHLSFAEYEQAVGRAPDVLVIPYLPGLNVGTDRSIVPWIRSHVGEHTLVVSVCAGAIATAEAGLFEGRTATTHHNVFAELEPRFQSTTWIRSVRYVEDGNVIAAAGITSGIDASLRTIERLAGRDGALATAEAVSYPHTQFLDDARYQLPSLDDRPPSASRGPGALGMLDFWLEPGVDELAVAAAIDVYPRAPSTFVRTVSTERQGVVSKHGLIFVAQSGPEGATGRERLAIPSGNEFVFERALRDLEARAGASVAWSAAYGLEYPRLGPSASAQHEPDSATSQRSAKVCSASRTRHRRRRRRSISSTRGVCASPAATASRSPACALPSTATCPSTATACRRSVRLLKISATAATWSRA